MTQDRRTTDTSTQSESSSVGQGDYVVRIGDCMHSIAHQHGFFWQSLWDLPENAELKRVREMPNLLLAGDRVFVPELRTKEEACDSDSKHRFRQMGVPAKLRLRLMKEIDPEEGEEDGTPEETITETSETQVRVELPEPPCSQRTEEPRANVRFVLSVDGRLIEGTTDDDGRLEVSIPPAVREATLRVEPGTENETVLPLQLGSLDPLATIPGIKERLGNIGYECGDRDENESDAFRTALEDFQMAQGLDATGTLNDETRDALEQAHGS